jgi:hypothetical protein
MGGWVVQKAPKALFEPPNHPFFEMILFTQLSAGACVLKTYTLQEQRE